MLRHSYFGSFFSSWIFYWISSYVAIISGKLFINSSILRFFSGLGVIGTWIILIEAIGESWLIFSILSIVWWYFYSFLGVSSTSYASSSWSEMLMFYSFSWPRLPLQPFLLMFLRVSLELKRMITCGLFWTLYARKCFCYCRFWSCGSHTC